MPTPEGKVKDAIKKRLEHYGLVPHTQAIKLVDRGQAIVGSYFMPVAGPYSVHGIHDFVGCWDSVFFSIETKAPDNSSDATPAQQDFRAVFSAAGGVSLVGVRDAAAVDHLAELIQQTRNAIALSCNP